jgi:hypothetical protein
MHYQAYDLKGKYLLKRSHGMYLLKTVAGQPLMPLATAAATRLNPPVLVVVGRDVGTCETGCVCSKRRSLPLDKSIWMLLSLTRQC